MQQLLPASSHIQFKHGCHACLLGGLYLLKEPLLALCLERHAYQSDDELQTIPERALDVHMRQGCTRHKPNGCPGRKCPVCILFACMWLLRKSANHLKLLQGRSTVRTIQCC